MHQALVDRSIKVQCSVFLTEAGSAISDALRDYAVCGGGGLNIATSIFIGSHGEAEIAENVTVLGGQRNSLLHGVVWLPPKESLLWWLTKGRDDAHYYVLQGMDNYCHFLRYTCGYLECVTPDQFLEKMFKWRFPLRIPEFLKSPLSSRLVSLVTKQVRRAMHIVPVNKKRFTWEAVFHEINAFISGIILHDQCETLLKIGGRVEQCGNRCGKWIPPAGSKLFGFKHPKRTDVVESLTGIILEEGASYYILQCGGYGGEEYYLCHSNGKIFAIESLPEHVIKHAARECEKHM